MRTLQGYLSRLLALPETGPVRDAPADLTELAYRLGLRLELAVLTPSAAAETSAPQTPLLIELAERGGWLVLYGFRSGSVRVALIHGDAVEERLIEPAEVAALLGLNAERPAEWLLVQAKAPLANAVSPDGHGHLPPWRRLVELLRADLPDLWLVLGLALGSGLLALASPVAVQALVNTVAMGGMGQPLLVLAVILFFFLAFAGAVHVLEAYLVEIVQRRVFVRLASDLAHRLPRVRREAGDAHHGAELVNRFFDVLTLQKAGSALLLDGLSTVVQTGVGLLMLAFYHPFLLAFDVVLLILIGVIVFVLGRGGVSTAIDESIAKYALVAWLETVAANQQIFKFAGGPRWAVKRTDALSLNYLDAKRGHFRVLLRQIIGSLVLYAAASTGLLALGGYLVIDGHLTLGQLVAAELIVSSALISLIKFGKHLEGFYDLMAGTDKIGHLLDLPLERGDGETLPAAGPLAVDVTGLGFAYGQRRPVFNDLSFAIGAGEKVALLAGHAAGKTTLAELLCGLRPAGEGRIEIGGVELGRLRLEALRGRLALVGRPEWVADTLFENVRLGRSDIDTEAVRQVLERLGWTRFGYDAAVDALATELTVGGAPLSAAQGHLVLLARAMVGRPGILIVDGLLDDMSQEWRDAVLATLCAEDAPWTLIVTTGVPAVARGLARVIEWAGENNGRMA